MPYHHHPPPSPSLPGWCWRLVSLRPPEIPGSSTSHNQCAFSRWWRTLSPRTVQMSTVFSQPLWPAHLHWELISLIEDSGLLPRAWRLLLFWILNTVECIWDSLAAEKGKKNVLELLFCFPSLKEPQRSFWWQAKVPRTSIFPSRDRSWLLMSAESGLVLSLKRKVSPILKSFSVPNLLQYWPLASNPILARLPVQLLVFDHRWDRKGATKLPILQVDYHHVLLNQHCTCFRQRPEYPAHHTFRVQCASSTLSLHFCYTGEAVGAQGAASLPWDQKVDLAFVLETFKLLELRLVPPRQTFSIVIPSCGFVSGELMRRIWLMDS